MTYALVVVLLLFLAAVSGGHLPHGARTRRFRTHGTTEKLRPPQLALSAILPLPAQAVHFR